MTKIITLDNCFDCNFCIPGENFNTTDIKKPKPPYCNYLGKPMYDFMDVYKSIYKDCPLEDAPND